MRQRSRQRSSTGIPHSILLKVGQDRFRLFWVTSSRVLSKRSGRIAGVCRVGDHIYGLSNWFIDGAQAEYCLTVPANIAPKPVTLKTYAGGGGTDLSSYLPGRR